MPQSVLVPARTGSKWLAMERQMEQPGLSFQDAATCPGRSIATCTTVAPTKLAACAGLVPWRDEQARTESSKTFGLSSPAACVGGLPGVTVKHPRVYSKIARRPNGSVRSRLCRWFSTYCIQLVVWRATLWMDGSDGMPTAQTCLFGIICGRRASCTFLVPVL
ncbi:hypothetical protein H0G86_012539 [Trichoderma simmonsii]|uniref:Uncharacterized protein n=1 Tax=Trichoderma simmonsii TaxID=1491479 RepID=A0A8G0LNP5_9HYPO|nr:hypothetical protein H0G86_012539 [Trichoderma simmonsii]